LCIVIDSQHYYHDWDNPRMKKLFPAIRSRPYLFYLILFLLMILPGIILFFAAQSGSSIIIAIFLSLVVLANAAAVLK